MATRKEEREARREARRQAEAAAQARQRRQRQIAIISGAGLLAIIAVVAAIVISQSGGSSGGSTDLTGTAAVKAELRGIPQSGPVLGEPGAKVTLIEYGDLQCSTCKLYSDQVMPSIISGQVRNGAAKLEFRAWPIIGPQSIPAAEAAYAAGEQDRFWNYITLFYRNQGAENSGYVTDDFTTAVAKGAGVPDLSKWRSDRSNPRWRQLMKADASQAQGFGFNGTPSFAVEANGKTKPIAPGSNGVTTPQQIVAAIKQAS